MSSGLTFRAHLQATADTSQAVSGIQALRSNMNTLKTAFAEMAKSNASATRETETAAASASRSATSRIHAIGGAFGDSVRNSAQALQQFNTASRTGLRGLAATPAGGAIANAPVTPGTGLGGAATPPMAVGGGGFTPAGIMGPPTFGPQSIMGGLGTQLRGMGAPQSIGEELAIQKLIQLASLEADVVKMEQQASIALRQQMFDSQVILATQKQLNVVREKDLKTIQVRAQLVANTPHLKNLFEEVMLREKAVGSLTTEAGMLHTKRTNSEALNEVEKSRIGVVNQELTVAMSALEASRKRLEIETDTTEIMTQRLSIPVLAGVLSGQRAAQQQRLGAVDPRFGGGGGAVYNALPYDHPAMLEQRHQRVNTTLSQRLKLRTEIFNIDRHRLSQQSKEWQQAVQINQQEQTRLTLLQQQAQAGARRYDYAARLAQAGRQYSASVGMEAALRAGVPTIGRGEIGVGPAQVLTSTEQSVLDRERTTFERGGFERVGGLPRLPGPRLLEVQARGLAYTTLNAQQAQHIRNIGVEVTAGEQLSQQVARQIVARTASVGALKAYNHELRVSNGLMRGNRAALINNSIGMFVLSITITQTVGALQQMAMQVAKNDENAKVFGMRAKWAADQMNVLNNAIRLSLGPIQVYTSFVMLATMANRAFFTSMVPIMLLLGSVGFAFQGLFAKGKKTRQLFAGIGLAMSSISVILSVLNANTKVNTLLMQEQGAAAQWLTIQKQGTALATLAQTDAEIAVSAGYLAENSAMTLNGMKTSVLTIQKWGLFSAEGALLGLKTLGVMVPLVLSIAAMMFSIYASAKAFTSFETDEGEFKQVGSTGLATVHRGEIISTPRASIGEQGFFSGGPSMIINNYVSGNLDTDVSKQLNRKLMAQQIGGLF